MSAERIDRAIRAIVATTPPHGLLRIRLTGGIHEDAKQLLRAAQVRSFAPAELSIEIRTDAGEEFRAGQREEKSMRLPPHIAQLDLLLVR